MERRLYEKVGGTEMRSVRREEERPGQGSVGISGLETAIVLIAFVVVSSVFAFAALSMGLFSSDQSKEAIKSGLGEAQGSLEVKGGIQINATTTGSRTSVSGNAASGADGGTALNLTATPVLPGSERIRVTTGGATGLRLVLGADYSINYDTGIATLTKFAHNVTADYTQYRIDSVDVNLANAAAGIPVDLSPGETLVSYQDKNTLSQAIETFGLTRLGNADADNLLENGEVFRVRVDTKTFGLTTKDEFTVQVKPPKGATVIVARKVPDKIATVMNLD
jgi:flagellin-like protein